MSNDKDKEFSESGSPIYRYETKEEKFEGILDFDETAKGQFEEHIEKYIGPINKVYHEIVSNLVHIDVYHVLPSEERPFHTLITHGMSDLPMNVPEGCEDWCYAELVCFLPKDWDISDEGFKIEQNYWAMENLKYLARFPHVHNTWLSYGHTVQNGDPIEPFIDDTELCASLLIPTILLSKEFSELKVREDKTIQIYNVFPIYSEEMNYKMKHGVDALLDKFDKYEINDVYDLNRVNTCKKKWFHFK